MRGIFCCAALAATVGCGLPGFGGGAAARPFVAVPEAPGEQAKCKVAAAHENPLVTEWPASEKANLEARLREGAVVVAYSGCTMRLMPQCRGAGRYAWRRTTTASDTVEIRDADELYAKLRLGAARRGAARLWPARRADHRVRSDAARRVRSRHASQRRIVLGRVARGGRAVGGSVQAEVGRWGVGPWEWRGRRPRRGGRLEP